MRDSGPVVSATGDVGFRTRAAHGRRGGVAQPGPVARTHGDALLSGRGRVGHIVRRLRDRGRGLGNEPRDNSRGHVTKVDEGGGASATLRALLGAGDLALGDHPVPGAVVDNLDVLVAVQLCLDLHGVAAALVPRAEVHENAPELLAVLVGLGNHVHALNEPKLQGVEDGADALLANVLEHPRDADAVNDGLRVARRALVRGGSVRVGHDVFR